MKAIIPKPVHESYRRHRRQRTLQIILPVVLAALLCLATVVLLYFAAFQGNGDVTRWAAVSTIWIVIPVMLAGLVFFVLLAGLIYLLARLLGIAPTYTAKAQDFVEKLATRIQRLADIPVKPIIYIDGVGASIKTLLGKK